MKLQVRNHQYWCFQKQHKTSLFWNRQAKVHVVLVSSDVLSAYRGGACMAECVTRLNIHAWLTWAHSYVPAQPRCVIIHLSVHLCVTNWASVCTSLKGLNNQNRTTYYLINERIDKVNFRFSEVSACTTIKRLRINVTAFSLHMV